MPQNEASTFLALSNSLTVTVRRHSILEDPIRRLDGITYWVIEDPDAIHDFINNELRKEWEEDARTENRDPREDTWLKAFSKRRWRLRTVDMGRIKLDPK